MSNFFDPDELLNNPDEFHPDSFFETDSDEDGDEEMEVIEFARYFTLEEAAALIPKIREDLGKVHAEIETIRDDIILFKRILVASKKAGKPPTEEQIEHLKHLYQHAQEVVEQWMNHFSEQGILLRDVQQGLIDFPYHSESMDEDFLLCWQLGEDGLFYFHPLEAGFAGRQPISLLPV